MLQKNLVSSPARLRTPRGTPPSEPYPNSTYVNGVPYPAYYQQPQNFLKPNAAFARRQIQLGLKFIF
jgi:hypothetical protein